MANNPTLGTCQCPICKGADALVLGSSEGKGKPYIKCDDCVSIVRTSSSVGARSMLAMVAKSSPGPAVPPADDKPEEKPAPIPAPKKKASWIDAI